MPTVITTTGKYNAAIAGQGLILQSRQDVPAYRVQQSLVFGNRIAQGDRSYNDFSKWWYMSQTDWSGGVKDLSSFVDDAKYYLSQNIDAYSEPGAIKLAPFYSADHTFAENLYVGTSGSVFYATGQTAELKFVGTDDGSNSKPHIYAYDGSWTDISSTFFSTNDNIIATLLTRKNYLWSGTAGVGGKCVAYYNYETATWVDATAHVDAHVTGGYSILGCLSMVDINGTLYVAVENFLNKNYSGIFKTTAVAPTVDGDWATVVEHTGKGTIPAMCEYGGNLYYLVNGSYGSELRMWNTSSNVDTHVFDFGCVYSNWGVDRRVLVNAFGKLVITVPGFGIWEYDGSTMTQVFILDSNKAGIDSGGHTPYITYGCVFASNKLWWGNLMYDGQDFFNTWNDIAENTSNNYVWPLLVQGSTIQTVEPSTNQKILLQPGGASSYRLTTGKNYLVFNNLDIVAGVDKIAYSVTILFKAMTNSDKITVKYTTNPYTGTTTWTTLGNASTSDPSGTIKKRFLFGDSVIFNKIWIRVDLDSDGNTTPVLYDLVMEYIPMPDQGKTWNLTINCANEIILLDGSKESFSGRELRSRFEKAWYTKSVLDFQDIDYASAVTSASITRTEVTSISVDDTSDFPESGRLNVEGEYIYYASKTPKTFNTLTRGLPGGSVAIAHSSAITIYTGLYKVLVDNFQAHIPILQKDKEIESTISLELKEVATA